MLQFNNINSLTRFPLEVKVLTSTFKEKPLNTAIELSTRTSGTGAIQKHYKLDPPMKGQGYEEDGTAMVYQFVVVSAVVPFADLGFNDLKPETLIFAANEEGKIVDFMDLEGSYRGGLDHEVALQNAGYTVVKALT